MRVDETVAGRRINAWIVLRDGAEVATVQAYHGTTGSTLVNVFNGGSQRLNPDAAPARAYQERRASRHGASPAERTQAALAGLSVCGVVLPDEGVYWKTWLEDEGLTVLRVI